MADVDRIELEPAGDGTRWRVRHTGEDVEGHMPWKRFAVEDEDVEGHRRRFKFSLEPDGEDEGGEPLFRIEGEGDVEGHAFKIKGLSTEEQDVEGHAIRVKFFSSEEQDVEGQAFRVKGFALEPTGEEEGGDPVYRVRAEGEDVEGHRGARYGG